MLTMIMSLFIIIPAYNEEARIGNTLEHYTFYFGQIAEKQQIKTQFLVVLNGCTDNTRAVVESVQGRHSDVTISTLEIPEAGKGSAIKAGFLEALKQDADLIGFVDADMATEPQCFFDLVQKINDADGAIASRYIEGARVYPQRPWIKRWGSRVFYESLVYWLLGLSYHDLQCGAKLFKRQVIASIAPLLTVKQWAFDAELLYLCALNNFTIKEVPTVWYDRAGSKLDARMVTSGLRMLRQLFYIRDTHGPKRRRRGRHRRT